jgi:S-adenosylmethionine:tRNA ribosyltransferase-isomerase
MQMQEQEQEQVQVLGLGIGFGAMLVSDFDYELPEELIAQRPPEVRGTSRMLTLDRRTGVYADRSFRELPSLLKAGDLLVLNDSRVIPARLFATREGLMTQEKSPAPSGLVEVLLTERLAGEGEWSALVRPAKKVMVGERLLFGAAASGEAVLRAEVIGVGEFGERTLRFDAVENFYGVLEKIGHLPLPPYIHREKDAEDRAEDRERYQTVYSRPLGSAAERGSSAAPTAGLHFTEGILEELTAKGVEIARLTLHVGLGTFQPVRVERTEEIRLHAENYTISEETAEAVNRARLEGRRIIAAGTTSTRTLEHVAREAEARGGLIEAHSGSTSLFLSPGAEFKVVGGLVTNFHLPQSTLLMLVSAFAGRGKVLAAYAHAVEARYRFFSYGDCMLVL